jgi:hypothetical protein
MAVGYHKLNTSAARSKNNVREVTDSAHTISQRFADIKAGCNVAHSVFGLGVVLNGGMLSDVLAIDFGGVTKKILATFIKVV